MQELNTELNWFIDTEQLLKEDTTVSHVWKELVAQRDVQKVSIITELDIKLFHLELIFNHYTS